MLPFRNLYRGGTQRKQKCLLGGVEAVFIVVSPSKIGIGREHKKAGVFIGAKGKADRRRQEMGGGVEGRAVHTVVTPFRHLHWKGETPQG